MSEPSGDGAARLRAPVQPDLPLDLAPPQRARRKRAERETNAAALLREAAIALRPLFEAEEAGLAILDAAGAMVTANAGYTRLLGVEGGFAGALPTPEVLVAEADRPALAALIEAALEGPRAPLPIEARPADPEAPADACLQISCRKLRAEPGVLLRVADATHRRRLERELAEASRLQAVGRLAGGVAHDFNNLLTAIMGSAEAVLEQQPAGSTAEEMGRILDAATRGGRLVRQLLAFARQQALSPRPVPLDEAVQGMAGLMLRLLGGGVRLDLALAAPGLRVMVDPGQLDQVVLNLAVNARDAMKGQGGLRLATGERYLAAPLAEGSGHIPAGDWVVLEVSDTGPGIAPEVLPHIFEPFFTTRREAGGSGLGLATVFGIVQQSGGHLTVTSRLGQGTRFRLWFPPLAMTVAAAPVASAPAPAARRTPAHVLLVEDEPLVRRLAERTLLAAGHRVTSAEDAEAALESLPEGAPAPDILVSDISMPGMDGVELAQCLRARFPTLPVLLASGYSERAVGLDLDGAGLRLLAKPYRAAELTAAVGALLAV